MSDRIPAHTPGDELSISTTARHSTLYATHSHAQLVYLSTAPIDSPQDTWDEIEDRFTADEWEAVNDVLVSPYYYA